MNSGEVRLEITKWLVTIHIVYFGVTWWRDEMSFSRTIEWEDADWDWVCSDPWPERYFQEHAL